MAPTQTRYPSGHWGTGKICPSSGRSPSVQSFEQFEENRRTERESCGLLDSRTAVGETSSGKTLLGERGGESVLADEARLGRTRRT
mmetsp:Transcript_55836/g.120718  ORF Transcript_55836/g.120718 Transcript_55836/m.120718 type:complete len:86 (-) Transcript_55836:3096-3353(-)